ncbi:MAG: ABC transporter substrate-binding protein [Desulfobacula sp.]|nr:ABC transporter substrate-binding protein [Desulfobacula sp.]
MKDKSCICIGHLRILDHLILGITNLKLKNNELSASHSNLEIKSMNSWDQVIDGLREQSINGAFIPAPIAMDLFASGLDIRLLMFAHRSGSVIVKNKNLNMEEIADFKGKTILVPSRLSIQNMLLHKLLSSANLKFSSHNDTSADVTQEIVNPFLMNEMLKNDRDHDIAGFAVAEPFGTKAVLDKIADKICTSHSLWKNHPCCVFVLNTSFMNENPEAVQEIVSLFTHTGHSIEKSDRSENFNLAQEFLGHKKEEIEYILLRTDISFSPSLLVPDLEALNIIQNYMVDVMGVLKNKIDVNLLVDSSYILDIISENKF